MAKQRKPAHRPPILSSEIVSLHALSCALVLAHSNIRKKKNGRINVCGQAKTTALFYVDASF